MIKIIEDDIIVEFDDVKDVIKYIKEKKKVEVQPFDPQKVVYPHEEETIPNPWKKRWVPKIKVSTEKTADTKVKRKKTRRTKTKANAYKGWTVNDIKLLSKMIEQDGRPLTKRNVRRYARILKRTEDAIKTKAHDMRMGQ